MRQSRCAWALACAAALALPGCTVVAVTTTAVGVTASAVGLAADAAVGTAKLVGKGVGKAVDALHDEPPADDASGVHIRYREPQGATPPPASP